MLDKLKNEHAELSEIARALLVYIDQDELTDPEGLGRCRWRFTRLLTAHLALEDAHVYAPLARDPRREAVAMSRWFKQELGRMLGDYTAHVQRWTAAAVLADWQGYRRDLRVLIGTLAARIELEEGRLYPLFETMQPMRRAA